MKILIDLRVLARPQFSGITEYAKHLVGYLLSIDQKNEYLLFCNGCRKTPLPEDWLNKPQVKIVDYSIPNRLLNFGNKIFNLPKIDKKIKADVFLAPILIFSRWQTPQKNIHFPRSFVYPLS